MWPCACQRLMKGGTGAACAPARPCATGRRPRASGSAPAGRPARSDAGRPPRPAGRQRSQSARLPLMHTGPLCGDRMCCPIRRPDQRRRATAGRPRDHLVVDEHSGVLVGRVGRRQRQQRLAAAAQRDHALARPLRWQQRLGAPTLLQGQGRAPAGSASPRSRCGTRSEEHSAA